MGKSAELKELQGSYWFGRGWKGVEKERAGRVDGRREAGVPILLGESPPLRVKLFVDRVATPAMMHGLDMRPRARAT
jgi:hypothetical protein